MNPNDPIHVSRLFDIVVGMGSKVDQAARIVQGRSLAVLNKAKEDFRSVIDNGTPTIYVIDIDKDIIGVLARDYPNIRTIRSEIENNLRSIAFETSYSSFTDIIDTAYSNLNQALLNLRNSPKSTHLAYRDAFRRLGQEMSKAFVSLEKTDKRNIAILKDPESIGQQGKLVFIGKSFTLVQKNINKAINSTVGTFVGDSKFSYGKYRAAGHTAVEVGTQGSMPTYGTNTPLTQMTAFQLEASMRGADIKFDKFKFQDDFVKQVPLFLEYKLDLNKNFSLSRKLLELNFTFVVPMDTAANQTSGSGPERAAIANLTKNIVMPGLAQAMKDRLNWLKEVQVNITQSPQLQQDIKDQLLKTMVGEMYKGLQQKVSLKTKKKIATVVTPKVTKPKMPKATGSSSFVLTSKAPAQNTLNLTNLQNLLNQRLHDQIRANMGTGQSRSTLNYRSGRLAESAKVERLSESRQGMITAFYTYMKYPYATFSEGGRQQYPRSRDPKLLISKSIREIAGTSVANRLRAVNV